jgi:hypothetical protein
MFCRSWDRAVTRRRSLSRSRLVFGGGCGGLGACGLGVAGFGVSPAGNISGFARYPYTETDVPAVFRGE